VRSTRKMGDPLSAEALRQLQALSKRPDSEIDFSDIPESPEGFWENAVRGPWGPLEEHTVTLRIDAEVAAWLEKASKENLFLINFALKRAAQRQKRAQSQSSSQLTKAS